MIPDKYNFNMSHKHTVFLRWNMYVFFSTSSAFTMTYICYFSKTTVFTINYARFSFSKKQQCLQWIIQRLRHILRPFWHQKQSRAEPEPSRAEPGRAELRRADLSRAEPNRADSLRKVKNRAETSQAGGHPRAIFVKTISFYNELYAFRPSSNISVFTMNLTTLL